MSQLSLDDPLEKLCFSTNQKLKMAAKAELINKLDLWGICSKFFSSETVKPIKNGHSQTFILDPNLTFFFLIFFLLKTDKLTGMFYCVIFFFRQLKSDLFLTFETSPKLFGSWWQSVIKWI